MGERRVIVVGAGAAGLMAAAEAARAGAETWLLEKMGHPGLKLGLSGNRRCNLTNVTPLKEFAAHFGPRAPFVRFAFSRFFTADLVALLENLGVRTMVEEDGRVFPASGRARDVVEALLRRAGQSGADLRLRTSVERLVAEHSRLVGAVTMGGRFWKADAVILATGGASYPATGSTGDGYELARTLGHTIVAPRPALVPIETAGELAPRLQGLSLTDVKVRVLVRRGKRALAERAQASGEMLFTHFGVSGPAVLAVSKHAANALAAGEWVVLSIDLKPALDERNLDRLLLRELGAHGKQRAAGWLKRLVPRKLVPAAAEVAGVSPGTLAHQVTAEERRRLVAWLKDFRLEVTGHRPLAEAIVTAGGVETREVNPRTMASRLVKGLYFAGEVLDIDADTGGYNLQAAFSTGWVAGGSAAKGQEVRSGGNVS
ncbi:MAG TPA: NAD(P)/FAD-dependent oxidoreductase [bacterium]|nr:NAD(P)/FAD-dependent oxidoreductase [bacterium]